jgi:hypothetical protein
MTNTEGRLYSEADVVDAFLDAQHADFSRTQVQRMVRDADRNGQSRDYGDGYMIYRTDAGYRATVAGQSI